MEPAPLQPEMVDSPTVVSDKSGHTKNNTRSGRKPAAKGEPTMRRYHPDADAVATDVTVYIGIDVAAEELAVCVLGSDLEVLARVKLPYAEEAVSWLMDRLPGCSVHAVYEAGPTGYVLLRWLRRYGCRTAFMVAPSLVPVASGDRVKTDKRDALKLATLLATHNLKDAFVRDLTDEQYADRQVVRCRTQARQKRTTIQIQVKSLLLMHNIRLPREMKNWSKRTRAWLNQVETGHCSVGLALREQLRWWEEAHAAVKRLDQLCKGLAEEERFAADVKRLRTIPGIGLTTAMLLLTELPDLPARFENGEALARYTGLVPTEYSTGKTQGRRGHLPGDGNAEVRSALVQAAWRLIAKDAFQRERYERLRPRCGGKKAIVAVARHLAMTVYAMMRDQQNYGRQAKEELQAAA